MTKKTQVAPEISGERYVELNNHAFATGREVHDFLAAELAFPDYYGHNLDALYDCLGDIFEPTTIRIRRTWHQDSWFKAIAAVIRDAAKRNPHLKVR